MKSSHATYYFLILVATVSVLACFGFGKMKIYGKGSFITILAYSVIKTYAVLNSSEDDENAIKTTRKVLHLLELGLRTIALPMYVTEILQKLGIFEKHIGSPIMIALILTVFYLLVSNSLKQDMIDLWTYSNTLGLAMIGYFKHNYYIAAAGVLLALGEYIFQEDKIRFDLTPDCLFNVFLSAFTATAAIGLLI